MNTTKLILLLIKAVLLLWLPAAAQELPPEVMEVQLLPGVVKMNKIKSISVYSEMRSDTTPASGAITFKSQHIGFDQEGNKINEINFGDMLQGREIVHRMWKYRDGKQVELCELHYQGMEEYLHDERISYGICKEDMYDGLGRKTGYVTYDVDSFPEKTMNEKVTFVLNDKGEVTSWKVERAGNVQHAVNNKYDRKGRQIRSEYEYYYRTKKDSVKKVSTTITEYHTDSSQTVTNYLNDTIRSQTYLVHSASKYPNYGRLVEFKRSRNKNTVTYHFKCRYDHSGNLTEIRYLVLQEQPQNTVIKVNNIYDKSGKLIKRVVPGDEVSMVYVMVYEYYP